MFSGISINEFRKKFKTGEGCFQYILDDKLAIGCACLKCGESIMVKPGDWHLRFKKCDYDASAMAGTLFHRCKLGM